MSEKDNDFCVCSFVDEVAVQKAILEMPSANNLYDLAEIFKVFSDLTRIRILCALMSTKLCVCDIAYLLEMSHSSISHQLRILKQANLVKYSKHGKRVYYTLQDEHVEHIFKQALIHVMEE